eukprot:TRINITY_DN12561_c0_g3_i2.p2 TRINITY_DN12561_c0_g3~~TRINITY_DN12561_c0_g3_i2.p2  ORF type:complete len:141 (-),score=26.53 TRINITY_DN12561_c0_g3_i2:229-651(-)
MAHFPAWIAASAPLLFVALLPHCVAKDWTCTCPSHEYACHYEPDESTVCVNKSTCLNYVRYPGSLRPAAPERTPHGNAHNAAADNKTGDQEDYYNEDTAAAFGLDEIPQQLPTNQSAWGCVCRDHHHWCSLHWCYQECGK